MRPDYKPVATGPNTKKIERRRQQKGQALGSFMGPPATVTERKTLPIAAAMKGGGEETLLSSLPEQPIFHDSRDQSRHSSFGHAPPSLLCPENLEQDTAALAYQREASLGNGPFLGRVNIA